jgi:hypothetical protein
MGDARPAVAHVEVHLVDRRRVQTDEHLARPARRALALPALDHFIAAMAGDENCLHASISPDVHPPTHSN